MEDRPYSTTIATTCMFIFNNFNSFSNKVFSFWQYKRNFHSTCWLVSFYGNLYQLHHMYTLFSLNRQYSFNSPHAIFIQKQNLFNSHTGYVLFIRYIYFSFNWGPIHTYQDTFESASFSGRIKKFSHPHLVYSNWICLSTRIRIHSSIIYRACAIKRPS